jgi:hypothetical protein
MYKKVALAAALVAFANPASAAFYIAQSTLDKSCSVVDRAPDGKKQVKVGELSFKSKEAATAGLMTAPECKP